MATCSFCGEDYPDGREACPHCGSDAETGWKAEKPHEGIDLPEKMEEEDYQDLLREEGLLDRPTDGGMSPAALVITLFLAAALVFLFVLS